jgi:hypothetical protein
MFCLAARGHNSHASVKCVSAFEMLTLLHVSVFDNGRIPEHNPPPGSTGRLRRI